MVEESFVPDGYTRNPGKIRFQISGNNQIELKENTSTVQNGKIQFEKTVMGAALRVEDACAPYKLLIDKKNEDGKKCGHTESEFIKDEHYGTKLICKKCGNGL